MWIYPQADTKNTPIQQAKALNQPAAKKSVDPAMQIKPVASQRKKHRTAKALVFMYLLGSLAASILTGWSAGTMKEFIHRYLSFALKVHASGDGMLVFSTHFLGSFFQLTLAMICGLCAFGTPLLYILVLMRGVGAGIFTAALYMEQGLHGFVLNVLLFWVPELLLTGLLIGFCHNAHGSARSIAASCFGHSKQQSSDPQPSSLLFRYLIFCAASMIPCAALAGLSLLLFRVF